MTLNTGAGSDTVNVGNAVNRLDDVLGPLTVNGQAGTNRHNLSDQGTPQSTAGDYRISDTAVEVFDAGSRRVSVGYSNVADVTLNGGLGRNVAYVYSTPAGTNLHVIRQPGVLDTFWLQADTNANLGNVFFVGQALDHDFGYYYDYANPNPQTYTFSQAFVTGERVERTGAAPAVFLGVDQVILFVPLVGGSTINVTSLPATISYF